MPPLNQVNARRESFGPILAGWVVLLLPLPLALFGAVLPANEYVATLGFHAVDCDGPAVIFMLAVPPLVLYGTGLLVTGWHYSADRRRSIFAASLLCGFVCVALLANIARATVEEYRYGAECR